MKLQEAEVEVPTTTTTMHNEGFRRLHVRYSDDNSSSVVRHLFAKQFSLAYHYRGEDIERRDQKEKPENRTLLLVNVPPFVTEHHIRYLFSEQRIGGCKLERIFLQEKPSAGRLASIYNQIQSLRGGDNEDEAMDTDQNPETTTTAKSVTSFFAPSEQHIMHYKVAYVVFQSPTGLEKALEMADSEQVFSLKPSTADEKQKNNSNFFTGLRLWQKQYNDLAAVQPWQAKKVAEEYLADFHKRAEEEAAKEATQSARRRRGRPDADGWTTVNRKLNRRDKTALVSSQFFDRKIREKYDDRAKKRRSEEAAFEEAVGKTTSMLETGKRKKRKGGRFNAVDFLSDKAVELAPED